MTNDAPVSARCKKCGLVVQVPPGGKRLCSCGNLDRRGRTGAKADVPLNGR